MIMRIIITLVLFFISFQCYVYPVDADQVNDAQVSKDFFNAIKLYNEGKFDIAASKFEEIANTGIQNGKLFYNIGNAYFRANDIGNAILWYERAVKLIPNDPDLNFNLNYAMTLVKDKNDEKTNPLIQVLFFWKDILGIRAIQNISIVFNIILCLSVILLLFFKKKFSKVFIYTGALLFLIFTSTYCYEIYKNNFYKQAIIIPASVSIRSGISDSSTELFVLHAGTKVIIQKQVKNFYRIYFSQGKIGWVKNSSAKLI